MKRVFLPVAWFGLALTFIPRSAQAQETGTIRGTVVDENGQPLPEVKMELEYKGETRQKIVRTMITDKKGAYLRVGLRSGQWQLILKKEGYKTYGMETNLSAGGISELPPITMKPAAVASADGPAPVALPASVGADSAGKQLERAKLLGGTYNKAIEALIAGRIDEAETLLTQVIAEFPDLAPAHHNLAFIQDKKGNPAAAEASYRKAIELQPQTSESYSALAALLMRQRREDDALKVMQDVADGFGQDASFQFALGALAFNTGRGAEAEAAFTKVAELDPTKVEVLFYLGSLAVARNDIPAAVKQLQKYLAAAPASAPNMATAKALLAALPKGK